MAQPTMDKFPSNRKGCSLTHDADSWQGQLLEEASDGNRCEPTMVTCPNHSVKAGLYPFKHFRVTLENGQNRGVGLLENADELGHTFRPMRKARTVVWSAKEQDAASAVEDLLDVLFWPLLCGS